MPGTESLGERIRRQRLALGMTQQDLATEDVHASYVSLIEAGKRQPTPRTLRVLAERLKTTPDYLTTGVEEDDRRTAELELGTARLILEDGRASEAVAAYRRLVDAADPKIASAARWGLAAGLEAAGDLERAIGEYESLREGAEADPPNESYLAATTALSRCYREAGDLGNAIAVGEQALTRYRQVGLTASDASVSVLLTITMAYLERGDLTKARQLLGRAQEQVGALGTPRARGAAYWNAAVLAGELGDRAEAVHLVERALALFGEGDDERNLARLRNAFAALLLRHDPSRAGEAAEMLRTARDRLTGIGSSVDVAYCETELARALTMTGQAAAAITVARTALGRVDQGMRIESARARAALAYALVAAGDTSSARVEYLASATALEAMGARRQAALVWLELAGMERDAGDPDQGMLAMERALAATGLTQAFPAPSPAGRPTPGRRARSGPRK
jgi:transcriptional regulator with XRE-family HTH domain